MTAAGRLVVAAISLAAVGTIAGLVALARREAGADPAVEVVAPVVETESVPGTGDAADDVAIWVNPGDPALSTLVATDKTFGLLVYDLDGRELQRVPCGRPNNVDLRSGFALGGERVAIVAASDRAADRLLLFRVNPATRRLEDVAARSIAIAAPANGLCLYASRASGDVFAFVSDMSGVVQQWRLFDAGTGRVDAELARTVRLGRGCEGMVADDERATLYLAEEVEDVRPPGGVSLWRLGAEPGDGAAPVAFATGLFADDAEGLALDARADGTGYLVASDQARSTFLVFRREGDHALVKRFRVGAAPPIDAVSETDGVEVTALPLGPRFPHGVLVVQDDANEGGRQNFKLVPLERVAPVESDSPHVMR